MARRAWLAAVLAFIYPGLGHAYLRAWLRSLAWFGLALSTVAWLLIAGIIPESALATAREGGIDGLLAVTRTLPTEARVAIFLVTALNVFDAYVTAKQPRQATPELACPECGRELDEDIDFCPWCTTRLDADAEAETEATSR
jgi:hypothetical protein